MIEVDGIAPNDPGEAITGVALSGTVLVLSTNKRVLVKGGKEPGLWRPFKGLNEAGWPIQDGFYVQKPDPDPRYMSFPREYEWVQEGNWKLEIERLNKK